MTTAVKKLLQSFDNLSDVEKQQATVEMLRRVMDLAPGPLPEEGLVAMAEELFLELDASESVDAKP